MKSSFAADSPSAAAASEKIRVALISVGAALFLTAAKAAVGIWTGSLALLSEAAHSGLDLFASLVTAVSVQAADRPPDRTHHYGHGKIESISALFEALLLLVVCAWILQHALFRLSGKEHQPFVNIYSFLVVLLAIGIDLYRYQALTRTSKRYHSQALEADALHFYSDILSSCLVFMGLVAVALGFPEADAFAAMLVAVWVGILAVRLGKKNFDVLIDRVPEGYVGEVRKLALEAAGVLSIEQLRIRRSGAALFADLRLGLDRTFPFEEAHRIARDLEERLAERFPGMDAVVHTDPKVAPDETLDLGILNFIRTEGYQAHHLTIRQHEGKLTAELHLEVEGELSIGKAHALASDLEADILRQFPELKSVQIHIEEIGSVNRAVIPWNDRQPELVERIHRICESRLGGNRCHRIELTRAAGELCASLHCLFPDDQPVSEVHGQTTQLEEEMRRSIPELDRVLIHAEPLRNKPRP